MQFTLVEDEEYNFLSWKGVFTEGNCNIRGTRVYFTSKGAVGYCTNCQYNYICDKRTVELTYNSVDHMNMRDKTLVLIIQEIKNKNPLHFWNENVGCRECNHVLIIQFNDKEGVLQELSDVLTYTKEHNVYQDWI